MEVASYLENKGYVYETDIEQIQIVTLSKYNDIFAAVVTFKDEPTVDYLYAYKHNSKELYQFDVYNKKPSQVAKHTER